jgi:nitrite reductase (NADH) large subunit
VVLQDSLGIAADLDAAMAGHVDGYVDEWAATLADPVKLRHFAAFVNTSGTADPELTDPGAYVVERGQRRPSTAAEKATAEGDAAGRQGVLARHVAVTRVGDDDQVRSGSATAGNSPVLIAGPRLEVTSR